MHFAFAEIDKGSRICPMAAGAMSQLHGGIRVFLHQKTMVLAMTAEIGTVTGLAGNSRHTFHASGTPHQHTGGVTVAGLASQSGVSLTGKDIRSRSRRCMTAHAQRNSSHGVTMAMAVKVSSMAGLAISSRRLAAGDPGKSPGYGVMTGLTTVLMHLTSGSKGGLGCDMAVQTDRDLIQGVTVSMGREIDTVTGRTVAAAWRHGAGLTVSSFQGAISVVAGGTGIMNLGVLGIDSNAGSRACRAGMTADTGRIFIDPRRVIGSQGAST